MALRELNNKGMNHYPSNLIGNQWQVIENFLDVQVRKRKYSLRGIVNKREFDKFNQLIIWQLALLFVILK